jgi:hypothetical protein
MTDKYSAETAAAISVEISESNLVGSSPGQPWPTSCERNVLRKPISGEAVMQNSSANLQFIGVDCVDSSSSQLKGKTGLADLVGYQHWFSNFRDAVRFEVSAVGPTLRFGTGSTPVDR